METKGLLRQADKLEERLINKSSPSVGFIRDRLNAGESILPMLFVKGVNSTYHNTLTDAGQLRLSPSTNRAITKSTDTYLTAAAAAQQAVPLVIATSSGYFWGLVKQTERRLCNGTWHLQLQPGLDQVILINIIEDFCEALDREAAALNQAIAVCSEQSKALGHLSTILRAKVYSP